jgi:hypothetical protein
VGRGRWNAAHTMRAARAVGAAASAGGAGRRTVGR